MKLILDTDICEDVEDVMALADLHALQTRGHCELLGVTTSVPDELAGPFVNAINTFYGRSDIPIGCTRATRTTNPSRFLGLVTVKDGAKLRYPHTLMRSSDTPEATHLLRMLLSRQTDNSVVLVQIGWFSNFAALLDTPGDTYSPLIDRELVKQKVRLLSVMAGAFQTIEENNHWLEYNVVKDLSAAQKLANDWPTPIVWSGFEIGDAIHYPATSIERDFGYVSHHPVAEAYYLYAPPPRNSPTWDETSVLYAVLPDCGYFKLSAPGRVTVEADGFTRFTAAADGRDRFLILNEVQAARSKETFVQLVSQPPRGVGK